MEPFENRLVPKGANGTPFVVIKRVIEEHRMSTKPKVDADKLDLAIQKLQEIAAVVKSGKPLDDPAGQAVLDGMSGAAGLLSESMPDLAPEITLPGKDPLAPVIKSLEALAVAANGLDVNLAAGIDDVKAALVELQKVATKDEPPKVEETKPVESPKTEEKVEGKTEQKTEQKTEESKPVETKPPETKPEGDGKGSEGKAPEGQGDPTVVTRAQLEEFGKGLTAKLLQDLQAALSPMTETVKSLQGALASAPSAASPQASTEVIKKETPEEQKQRVLRGQAFDDLSNPEVIKLFDVEKDVPAL